MNLIFDIETVGVEFETLAESQKEFLLRYTEQETDFEKKEIMVEDVKRCLSLYPYTSKLVALAMMNTETEKTVVLYEGEKDEWKNDAEEIVYKPMQESQMLNYFWKYAEKSQRLISFNGRGFDLPYLMIRSALLKIKPSKNLVKNRYDFSNHIDLLEQLTFYGLTKKFNLDFYCRSFGIDSPKSQGITGMEVKELYKAGRIEDIAIYCGKDVNATNELYKIWNSYLNIN